jgi:hypothetical protein
MFNCYVIIFAGSEFSYLKTEVAAENTVKLYMKAFNNEATSYRIEGRFIEGIF